MQRKNCGNAGSLKRRLRKAQYMAAYVLFNASPLDKTRDYYGQEDRQRIYSRRFKNPNHEFVFAILERAIFDIGFREPWLPGVRAIQYDTRPQFARGEYDYIAELLGIDAEYMRDILKKVGLIGKNAI